MSGVHETVVSNDMCWNDFTIDVYTVNQGQFEKPSLPDNMPRNDQILKIFDELHDGPWDNIRLQFINGKLVNWSIEWSPNTVKYNPNCIAYWKYWRKQLEETHLHKYAVVVSFENPPSIFHTSQEAITYMEDKPGAYYHHIGHNCRCITSTF